MNAKPAVTSGRLLVAAVTVAATLLTGNVAAGDHYVTVAIHVSTQGVDLTRPAAAQKLYTRLQNAARVACTRGDQVGLAPVEDLQGCIEQALGGAVRSAKSPMLTRIYLQTHTPQAAAAQGIEVPVQVATK
jgi:UrcA family protein